jgi:ribosomal protein S18 acetylase RimI-like enzyme
VWGLRNDEEVIGTVMVGHDGHRGWVYYLAVVPTHQGQGLGKELMKGAEDWFPGRDVVKVQLMVRHSNEAVAGFYQRLGYNDDEVRVLSRWLIDNGRQHISSNGDQSP